MKRRSWLVSAFVLLIVVSASGPAGALEEADRLYLVGEGAVADGLHALAARVLERFITDHPNDRRLPAATLLLGRAWLGVGLDERALETFRKAQQMSPPAGRPLEARLWEGEVLFRLKRYVEARAVFDDILQTDAASPFAPDAVYGLAWAELESQRHEAAVKAFEDFLATWPEHRLVPTATVALARLLIDLQRYPEAVALLAGFPASHPRHALRPDAQYLVAVARVRGGETRTGLAELRAFVEANPTHDLVPAARRLIGETVARVGDPDDLQAAYNARINESPATAEGLYEAATIAGRLGRPGDQEAAWRRLRTEFPEDGLARRAALDLATTAFKRQEWQDVAALARAAAQSDDESLRAEAWLLAGEADLKLKRYADAVKAFEGATAVEGAEAAIRYRALAGLGLAHEEQQHWRPALAAYETVASQSPDKSLRDWAEERAKAVKARLSRAPAGKPVDAKPQDKS